MSLPSRWMVGEPPEDPQKALRFIGDRLRELEYSFNQLCDIVEFGALPGQVQLITWNVEGAIATGVANSMRAFIPSSSRPYYFSASVRSGGVTLDLEENTTSVLVADLVLTGVDPAKETHDFVLTDSRYGVSGGAAYRVRVVSSTTGVDLCCVLALINVGALAI